MNPTPKAVRSKAYYVTARALRDGTLKRPKKCSVRGCKKTRPQAHHADYTKPLEVEWLCGSHHKRAHIAAGEVDHWRDKLKQGAATTNRKTDRPSVSR